MSRVGLGEEAREYFRAEKGEIETYCRVGGEGVWMFATSAVGGVTK